MNLQGQVGAPGGKLQVSTMAAGCGLLAAGGFTGELAVQSTTSNRPMSLCVNLFHAPCVSPKTLKP